jgi:hypothetical protein
LNRYPTTGCGTGEDVLYMAAQGHEVWGRFCASALQKAQEKAAQRHLAATFLVSNVLEPHTWENVRYRH